MWLIELPAQLAEYRRCPGSRLTGQTSRPQLTQPFDLTSALHAILEMLLHEGTLVGVECPTDVTWQSGSKAEVKSPRA